MTMRASLLILFLSAQSAMATPVDPAVKLHIWLKTATGHLRAVSYKVPQAVAQGIENQPSRAEDSILNAKRDFAERYGYSRARYGNDNWKVMPALRFEGLELVHPTGRKVWVRTR